MMFDEKAIIALAFFVCLGLIIKFSKNGVSRFLSSSRDEICKKLDDNQNILDELKIKVANLEDEKVSLIAKNVRNITNAENEKVFLINQAKKKADELLNSAIENQKNYNNSIKNQSLQSFERISWDSAKETLIKNLTENPDSEVHEQIIDKILSEV